MPKLALFNLALSREEKMLKFEFEFEVLTAPGEAAVNQVNY